MASLNLLSLAIFGWLLIMSSQPVSAADLAAGSNAVVLGTDGSGLRVRSGPGLTYDVETVLPEGTRVHVLDGPRSDGDLTWYQIRSTDGAEVRVRGWVSSRYLASPDGVTLNDLGAVPTREFVAKVLAYAPSGGISSYTATGTLARWGTVAVDPKLVPYGSLLTIDGLEGVFTAEDTGPAVKGAVIDVWFPDRASALRWGNQQRTVRILREGY